MQKDRSGWPLRFFTAFSYEGLQDSLLARKKRIKKRKQFTLKHRLHNIGEHLDVCFIKHMCGLFIERLGDEPQVFFVQHVVFLLYEIRTV